MFWSIVYNSNGDDMKKVVNEYIYDLKMLKKFYKVNLQTNFFLVLLMLVLLSTISSFLDKDISFGIFSLVVFLLGCIYYFFFPNILATISYRRLLTKNNNQEMHIKVTVNEKEIFVKNNLSKQKDKYLLEDIKKVRKKKDIICMLTKEKVGILLAKEGFKTGDIDVLFSILANAKSSKK